MVAMSEINEKPPVPGRSSFESTHWSIILKAGDLPSPDSQQALEALCGTYWYPLYAYARRQGYALDEAEDLVQAFFARLLEGNILAVADPARGRFRSFLRTAFRNFSTNERERAQAQKRGGGVRRLSIDVASGESRFRLEPAHELTAERFYEKQWAVTLLDHVMSLLRDEFVRDGKERQFDCLKAYLPGGRSQDAFATASGQLGISRGAAMAATSRLRGRYRELLRTEISRTVANEEEVDDEIGQLFDALGN
jgi:RNA polymerase sigma-70 factor (ECF subfamily)